MKHNEQSIGYTGLQDQNSGHNGSTFDQIKSTVADKLHSAARTLHQTADKGTGHNEASSGLAGFGHRAADWLDHSADYVSEMEPQRMRRDLENQVRQNPGRSLLIAGAVGLLLGGILRRR